MDEKTALILSLGIGCLLDLIFGDPATLPHPIVFFGKAIHFFDSRFNTGRYRFVKGCITTGSLVLSTFIITLLIQYLLFTLHIIAGITFVSICVFYGLAHKTLITEARSVFHALEYEGLSAGQQRLSRIVGRDTHSLNSQQVRIACLETLSENLNDGVISPLFYFSLGGAPLLLAYKMINTLDSMIGHTDSKYFWFGKCAARLDDVANFIPARLTAMLMACVDPSKRVWKHIFRYGRSHASPNSGYPEAALSGILDCQFGGPHHYDGELLIKPYIGENQRVILSEDFVRAARVNHKAYGCMILLSCALLWLQFRFCI